VWPKIQPGVHSSAKIAVVTDDAVEDAGAQGVPEGPLSGGVTPPETYAVTAVGPDAPGEVAALAEALVGLGANVEDASMTRLRGHFAMTLIAVSAAAVTELEAALAAAATGLDVTVRILTGPADSGRTGTARRLTVHGSDRPGIVATVARAVADRGGNITDLTCRLVGDLYVMTVEVDLDDPTGLAEQLVAAGLAARVTVIDEDLL
jgi:glycine cleavage system transcriptional repressor